jgi:signal transduction histidine kinase
VKHAGATEVKISVDCKESRVLRIQIQDNGTGFNLDEKGEGLGLSSMQKHMQNIGGLFEIKSDPTGTVVELSYTL